MAGVAIEDPTVTQVAGQAEASIIGQQKQQINGVNKTIKQKLLCKRKLW